MPTYHYQNTPIYFDYKHCSTCFHYYYVVNTCVLCMFVLDASPGRKWSDISLRLTPPTGAKSFRHDEQLMANSRNHDKMIIVYW